MRHWSFEVGGGRGRRGALRCIAKNVDSTANRALERTGASTVPRAPSPVTGRAEARRAAEFPARLILRG